MKTKGRTLDQEILLNQLVAKYRSGWIPPRFGSNFKLGGLDGILVTQRGQGFYKESGQRESRDH